MKIVIVEDDKNVRDELGMLLTNALYEVEAVSDFEHVAEQIVKAKPDLVLLDISLPVMNGYDVCRQLQSSLDIPVIFLTSDDEVMTEVNGMLMGADDFITKPYHPSVLLARITAVLKRTRKDTKESSVMEYKGVRLDLAAYKIMMNEKEAVLSKNECRLLSYLFSRKGEVIPRLDIIEYLWDNDVFIDDNALSVNVNRLRCKLEAIGASADYIETKRGVGYLV